MWERAAQNGGPSSGDVYVVGVDLGGTKVRAAIADLAGTVLAERLAPTAPGGGLHVVRQLAALAGELREQAGVGRQQVSAMAVGSPGVVHDGGRIRLAENIDGLGDIGMAEELAATTGCEVIIENDANLAAIGEHRWGSGRHCDTFAVLSVGTGVGLGMIVEGRLLRGAHGAAGEVAFLPIGVEPSEPEALRHGAFEIAVAKAGIEAAVRRGLRRGCRSGLAPEASAMDVFRAAAERDPLAVEIVREEARLLAHAILAIAAVIDPELVIMAGGIGSDPVLIRPLRAELARVQPHSVRVAPSALGARSGVVGAVAVAVERACAVLSTTTDGVDLDG